MLHSLEVSQAVRVLHLLWKEQTSKSWQQKKLLNNRKISSQQDISLEHPISTRVVRPKESEFLISLSLISYKELKGPQRHHCYLVWFPNKIWMLASQKWQFWQFISQFSKNIIFFSQIRITHSESWLQKSQLSCFVFSFSSHQWLWTSS